MNFSAQSPALKAKLGDGAFLEFSETLDSAKTEWKKDMLDTATDRFERRLGAEISAVRLEIAATHRSLVLWVVGLWVAQVAVSFAIANFLLNALNR